VGATETEITARIVCSGPQRSSRKRSIGRAARSIFTRYGVCPRMDRFIDARPYEMRRVEIRRYGTCTVGVATIQMCLSDQSRSRIVRLCKGEDGLASSLARTLDMVGCVWAVVGRTLDMVGCVWAVVGRTLDMVGCVTLKRLSNGGTGPMHGDDDGDLTCVRCGCRVVLEPLPAHRDRPRWLRAADSASARGLL